MDKQNILKKYNNPEDKLLISKLLDQEELSRKNNKITSTDFLNLNEEYILKNILKANNIDNYIISGGANDAERKTILFYPEKLTQVANENPISLLDISVIRICIPKELEGMYTHKDYLGALIKIGIAREKIGDIIVSNDGADILIKNEITNFALSNLKSLTRFSKAEIFKIDLKDIRTITKNLLKIKIIVPSMRLDAVVSELARTSRNKANELLNLGKVFVNFENITKGTKQVKEKDIITIRNRGRFVLEKIEGQTKSGRNILLVNKYI